jgi:hypothetical protein
LYGEGSAQAGPTGQCLELARRQLARLKQQADAPAAEQLSLVLGRLRQADRLLQADPARAKNMYQAVIELYGNKPWAADAVRHARSALEAAAKSPATPGKETSGKPTSGNDSSRRH